ncbi:TetR/AcrR family transcriptional regulator [Granulicella sp. dw_53]|uniref:TetR/AcrR family transcriptional regulator n=1 Tax=Granulicella sp. dw_53 TaxID=2719792 RepID=UPI001BD438A9|nr:TetR/AcrR family transcriptional regulator [Granulicella sp. dw_53]
MVPIKKRSEVRNSKLSKVAADLFLKHGYEGVSIDRIVDLAGGSKSTVYTEFGGKCGLFISSIEKLCVEMNEPLRAIDYTGLGLEASLKKLAFSILKLTTAKRSVELHRLAISEAANCPEVGEAWYTHGPARTASFIQALLEDPRQELPASPIPIERTAVILHDALTGDVLYRLLSGVAKRESEAELHQRASTIVDLVLRNIRDTPTNGKKKRPSVTKRPTKS